VMSAIERCRTAALGGHVERCEKCSHTIIAYNSCAKVDRTENRRPWLSYEALALVPVPQVVELVTYISATILPSHAHP
jgi:hypothetical protein